MDYPYINALSLIYLTGLLSLMARERATSVQFGTEMEGEAQKRIPNVQVNGVAFRGSNFDRYGVDSFIISHLSRSYGILEILEIIGESLRNSLVSD
jgi:hypothetical protein